MRKSTYVKTELKKVCNECGENYITGKKNQKYCSQKCYRIAHKKSYTGKNKITNILKLSPLTVGAMSEIFISADLIEKGYDVLRAMSPNCSCDLVIIDGEKMYRVEVRTGMYGAKGNIQINFDKCDLLRSEILAIRTRDGKIKYYKSELPLDRKNHKDIKQIIKEIS